MTDDPGEARYGELAARVDAFFGRVRARYPGALSCAVGCSACCHQHLSVVPSEFRRIARAVLATTDGARAAIASRVAAGRDDPRCPLLDEAGACRVYDARPMICRSHGLPVQVAAARGGDGSPQAPLRDVCPLNFTDGPDVADIDADCVLDLDHLDTVLGLLDRLAADVADANGAGARVDLFEGLAFLLAQRATASREG